MRIIRKRLKILILKVHFTVILIIMVLMWVKHGLTGIGFISQHTTILWMVERLEKVHQQQPYTMHSYPT